MFAVVLRDKGILIFCFLAAVACHLVFAHVGNNVFSVIPEWHQMHLSNLAPAPLQYRWLSYYLPGLGATLGIPLVTAYLALRLVYLFLAFVVIANITRHWVANPLGSILCVALVALYYAASTQAHLQPSEEPNLLFFSLIIYLVIKEKNIAWLALVMVLGALYKDTIGFTIPFVFLAALCANRSFKKAVVDSAILSLIFVSIYIGLRIYFGTEREYLGGLWQASYNMNYFLSHKLSGSFWAVPSLLPLLMILCNWYKMPVLVRCFVPSLVLFIVGHLLISRIEEFRTYTPLAALTFPVLIAFYLRTTAQSFSHASAEVSPPTEALRYRSDR